MSPTTPASRSTPPHFIDLANRNGNPANTVSMPDYGNTLIPPIYMQVDSLDLRTPTPYSSRQKLEYASHLALNGPSTPVVSVHSLMCSTQPVIMDTSGKLPSKCCYNFFSECSTLQFFCRSSPTAKSSYATKPILTATAGSISFIIYMYRVLLVYLLSRLHSNL